MYPLKHKDSVIRASQKYNVNKELIFAVIKCESGFDYKACSHANAKGLMQITPETFNWLKSCYTHEDNLQESDLEDPDINISYGTLLISILSKKYKSKSAVLSAYNAGMSVVSKWLSNKDYSKDGLSIDYIPYEETRKYVARVKKAENIYKKLYFNEGEC